MPHVVGRYAVYGMIASGGMATVHLGRLLGPVGFSRTVAIKRMLPLFAEDPEFVSMFLDEARLAARIRHPNVVPTLDVVATEGELFLVMDYVQGETLARLLHRASKSGTRIPLPVAAAIVSGALHGLHAAHEAKNEQGEPLGIVHRDVSPQNVMVGIDGIPRVLDFGVAKATGRLYTTRAGQLKGKIPYMAPELLKGVKPTRRSDVFAASVVFWELLTGQRLFEGDNNAVLVDIVAQCKVDPPSKRVPGLPAGLDDVVMRGLERIPEGRYATARAMASAIEECVAVAIPSVVGAWVEQIAGESIARQAANLAAMETGGELPPDPSLIELSPVDKDNADTPTRKGGAANDSQEEPTRAISEVRREPSESVASSPGSPSQIPSVSITSPDYEFYEFYQHRRRIKLAIGAGVGAASVVILIMVLVLGWSSSPTPKPAAPASSVEPPVATVATSAPANSSQIDPVLSASVARPADSSTPAASSTGKKKPPAGKGSVIFRDPG
ncbi:MAG: protein kinase [Deltaproteobacteria bacterium]|nr:protein kinase [Deltaproteobacteria bacterium]